MCFTPEQKLVISLREMFDEKASSKEIAYVLTGEAVEGLDARMKIFVDAVLGPCSKSLAEYTVKKCKYFKAVAKEDETKQVALLGGFEAFLSANKKEYAKETPL